MAHIQEAVETVRKSFSSGKTRSPEWRIAQLNAFLTMMREGREELSRSLFADLHKSSAESFFTELNLVEHEIHHMLTHLEEYMTAEKVPTDILNVPGWSYIYKDPLGVCLILGAWNYPVQLTLLPLVGCIAAGNCAIVKVPSANYSAKTSHTMATLAHKYLDTSCIRFIEGDRVETQQTLSHRYDLIFFTGGQFVGKMVAEAAAKNLTPTVLELGGKSPCIVDKTANLEVAAKRIAWATYLNAGQTCLRPDYLLIHKDVAKEFYDCLKRVVAEFYSPDSKKTDFFGRVINQRAHERLRNLVTSSKQYIVFGGECDESQKYVAPTLFDFGTNEKEFLSSSLMADEIFGPLLPSLQFSNLDQVISFISSRDKPLGLYCFTTDDTFRDRILTETSSGVCNINDCMMNMSNEHLPFGGVGASGMGSYHGRQSFMTFSHRKSVLMKTNYLDMPLRYPPYGDRTVEVMKFVLQARPAWHYTVMKVSAALAVCVAVFSRFSLGRVSQISRL